MAAEYWVESECREQGLVPGTVSIERDKFFYVELGTDPCYVVPTTRLTARHEYPDHLMAEGSYECCRWRVVD